jgi:hypothetical protein
MVQVLKKKVPFILRQSDSGGLYRFIVDMEMNA